MAPTRPFWKGYLKLSLVSCPIAVYPATSSTERVSFRQINVKVASQNGPQLLVSNKCDLANSNGSDLTSIE
jgi:DNA end-binding protein Ku